MTAHYPSTPGVRFKEVDGFPGYCVGDDGSVWSRCNGKWGLGDRWRQLRPFRSGARRPKHPVAVYLGQPSSGVRSPQRQVHRLILETFVGPCPPGHECCHANDQPTDNRLVNLRWGTHLENAADRQRNGSYFFGSRAKDAKLTEADIPHVRKLIRSVGCRGAGRLLGMHHRTLSAIARGKAWKHVPAGESVDDAAFRVWMTGREVQR
jgi:hypothetical protein